MHSQAGSQTKTGNGRAVPIVGDARTVLERRHAEWKKERGDEARADDHVLHAQDRPCLGADYTSKRFKYFVRKAGLPKSIHFHSLRHTCGSWMAQQGVPLMFIQHALGHSGIEVTQQYTHLVRENLHEPMQAAFESQRLLSTDRTPVGTSLSGDAQFSEQTAHYKQDLPERNPNQGLYKMRPEDSTMLDHSPLYTSCCTSAKALIQVTIVRGMNRGRVAYAYFTHVRATPCKKLQYWQESTKSKNAPESAKMGTPEAFSRVALPGFEPGTS